MYILGLNAYHGDSSAALIKDGKLVAALEEERIRRVKHWAGLPTEAIKFCLEHAGIDFDDIDYIAVAKDPKAHFWNKIWYAAKTMPKPSLIFDRIKAFKKSGGIAEDLAEEFNVPAEPIRKKIRNIEHHKAHIGSSFFVSPFEKSAVATFDGLGDFVSAMWGMGNDNKIEISDKVMYPHSLGFFYTAITQYLGFWNYGDEYKVMGLSAFGKPVYEKEMKEILRIKENGKFELNLKYFIHHKGETSMTWQNCAPEIGRMFSPKLEELLGPAREKGEELNERLKDIAASLQKAYEDAFFALLDKIQEETGETRICLAGGTIQNSLANGKIFEKTNFKEVYIPPAAYDAGNAVGAAFYLWNQELKKTRTFFMESPFWGPEYNNSRIKEALDGMGDGDWKIEKFEEKELLRKTAKFIAEGNIIGWFQGRTEWGPRALGNRSILANPAYPEIKDILNRKIKKRESFRPFAPSVLEEKVDDYFLRTESVPFMEKVYIIRPEKREQIPSVTHVDGTGRLQTVSRKENSLYWDLINEFFSITGVPMVLNTSFNENEPIVNKPEEAISCFLRTDMDVLVIGNYLVSRN